MARNFFAAILLVLTFCGGDESFSFLNFYGVRIRSVAGKLSLKRTVTTRLASASGGHLASRPLFARRRARSSREPPDEGGGRAARRGEYQPREARGDVRRDRQVQAQGARRGARGALAAHRLLAHLAAHQEEDEEGDDRARLAGDAVRRVG